VISMLAGARTLLRPKIGLLALPLALGLGMVPSHAAGSSSAGDPIYLKVDTIPGDSTAKGHTNEIEVLSFQLGVTHAIDPVTGLATGKAKFSEFTITKLTDRTSPLFFQASADGDKIKQVKLSLNRGGPSGGASVPPDYMKFTLTDVTVTSYHIVGGSDPPTETIGFSYGQIVMSYTPQKPDGTLDVPISRGWDLKSNVKM
jgi:type VI secretion system secreted protein Hcp